MPDESRQRSAHDWSNGWEGHAAEVIRAGRGSRIGVPTVEAWARSLPPGAAVLDLGCGPGTPRSAALAALDVELHAIDASPTLAAAYRERFPHAHVACEPVEGSRFFDRQFDGVLAWGVLFLLGADAQRAVIARVAAILNPGGRFLFTAPTQLWTWHDLTTRRLSLSLGAGAYREMVAHAGLVLVAEHDDEGGNHYYEARRSPPA